MAQDALVGFWVGQKKFDPKPDLGTDDNADLLYLLPATRGLVIDGELASLFRVEGADRHSERASARVLMQNQPLFHLVRPPNRLFHGQLEYLRAYSDLRNDRITEITLQVHDILSFFGAVGLLDDGRRRYTLELLKAVYRLVYRLEQQVKHFCRAPRPIDYSDEVQPIIQTPDHSTFPSGHAVESFAIATVLHHLMDGRGDARSAIAARAMPFRVACRIAVNRTVAGVHFPVDSVAGAVMGCVLGDSLASIATATQVAPCLAFSPSDTDFTLPDLMHAFPGKDGVVNAPETRTFGALWTLAKAEWS
jgi:membrane-associated phospholipid phosphatase